LQSFTATVLNERTWHFRGEVKTLTLATYFHGVRTPATHRMARYGLFVLKVPLNPNQPTNHRIYAPGIIIIDKSEAYRHRLSPNTVYH